MSVQQIADRYGFSRSSFYRILHKYRKPLYNLNFRHNYHTRALCGWQGGKTRLLSELVSAMPKQWDPTKNRLYEVFAGMASLSMLIQPEHLVLNDINKDLINVYQQLVKNPQQFINTFKFMKVKTNENYYYQVRHEYNFGTYPNKLKRACDFLFVINNCFNSIVRFNRKSQMDTGYNKRQNRTTVSLANIHNDSKYLRNIDLKLLNDSYLDVFKDVPAHKHDLIYFDPPYDDSRDSMYTIKYFGVRDQIKLCKLFTKLNHQGCYVMETNADTERIRTLYYGFNITPIKNSQSVNTKGTGRKRKFREVIIRNY